MSIAENRDLEIEINRVANNESLSTSAFLEYFCGMNSLESKVVTATKWSALTEIASKLISPIAGMILARLLTPEAYGAVATTTIIISFAEMLTDAGFQRYLIQHDFDNDEDKHKCADTAFWINLTLSIVAWLLIVLFRHPLAQFVGSPELGNAIAIACSIIPITAFSSIQAGFYKRDLDFKPLFKARMIVIAIPFCITIPLALWLRNYWALIAGSIAHSIIYAIALTINSKWKPSLRFSYDKTKEMASFWAWTSAERIMTYITGYIDLFLISNKFDQHLLGIYRTSLQTSTHIVALISAIVVPVLLPTYSQFQSNYKKLKRAVLKIQKHLSVFLLPIGIGIFLYSDLITKILLGSQWCEAAPIIGIWGMMHAVSLLLNRSYTNTFIAIGKPRIPVLIQALYASALIPAIIISANISFNAVYTTRTFIKIWLIVLNCSFIFFTIKLSFFKTITHILPEIAGCIALIVTSTILSKLGESSLWQIISIMICAISYLSIIFQFKSEKIILYNSIRYLKKKLKAK
ncbi:MAG: lipopolysaccharide biosynthesis protein [Salinivirgaceae bacterium]|nr:lipopolysaccharide biosynthesis protein [Salinivirgaceae bacterium]